MGVQVYIDFDERVYCEKQMESKFSIQMFTHIAAQ